MVAILDYEGIDVLVSKIRYYKIESKNQKIILVLMGSDLKRNKYMQSIDQERVLKVIWYFYC